MPMAALLRNIARLICTPCDPVEEQTCFAPGNSFASFELGGLKFGFSICYDLRFPELYRKLVTEKNVDAFVISSAWPFPRVEHFRVLAQARAIENQAYVIASNRVGKDDELWFCGSSAIIDPRGVVIAAASADREELIHADLSQELVRLGSPAGTVVRASPSGFIRLVNRIELGNSLARIPRASPARFYNDRRGSPVGLVNCLSVPFD